MLQSGQITSVVNNTTQVTFATYDYDEAGQRIKKKTIAGTTINETLYIRDMGGNIVTTSSRQYTSGASVPSYATADWSITAMSRVGSLIKNGAYENYVYELNDHLGNMRTNFMRSSVSVVSTTFDGGGAYDQLFKTSAATLVAGTGITGTGGAAKWLELFWTNSTNNSTDISQHTF